MFTDQHQADANTTYRAAWYARALVYQYPYSTLAKEFAVSDSWNDTSELKPPLISKTLFDLMYNKLGIRGSLTMLESIATRESLVNQLVIEYYVTKLIETKCLKQNLTLTQESVNYPTHLYSNFTAAPENSNSISSEPQNLQPQKHSQLPLPLDIL